MERDKKAVTLSSFYYGLNLLKMLLQMGAITETEFKKILDISAEYYGVELYCV